MAMKRRRSCGSTSAFSIDSLPGNSLPNSEVMHHSRDHVFWIEHDSNLTYSQQPQRPFSIAAQLNSRTLKRYRDSRPTEKIMYGVLYLYKVIMPGCLR